MPRLQLPQDAPQQGTKLSAEGTAGAIASGAKLGQLQASAGSEAVANRAKLGQIQSTQGAAAMADTGRIGAITQGPGAAAAAQYADIGKSAMHVGQEVMAQGNEYFQKAQASIDDAIYNNAYADASKEFNQRVDERLNQRVDSSGAPNFSTLQADIDKISSEVYGKYSSQIGNSENYNRFAQSFTSLSNSRSIMAMGEARKQQLDFSRGSLDSSLNTITTNALAGGREMLPQYLAEGNDQIDRAYKNGTIDLEFAIAQKERQRSNINVGWLQIQNQKDPVGTSLLLKQDNSALGINEMERAKLTNANQSELASLAAANKQRANEEKALQNEVYNRNNLNLDLGITKGTVTESMITDSYAKGDISQGQMVARTKQLYAAKGITAAKTQERIEIGSAVKNGEVLTGKFSNSQINDHYKDSVALQGGNVPLFDPNAPIDKARLASTYKAPVTSFTDEIAGTVATGTPSQVIEAVKAYEIAHEKNNLSVSGISDKDAMLITKIKNNLKYTSQDPGPIIEQARKDIFDSNPTIRSERIKNFDKEEKFKPENINDTIKGMYDTSGIFSKSNSVPDEAIPEIKSLLQDAYASGLNDKDSIDFVKDKTKGIIGESKVSGRNGNMILPPEYTYPQYNFTVGDKPAMRIDVEESVKPLLVKGQWADQSGIKPEDVEVTSYYGTSRQVGNARYTLVDKNTGHPLLDPNTGEVMTWSPDKTRIEMMKQEEEDKVLNKAMGIRQDKITEQQNAEIMNATRTGIYKPMEGYNPKPVNQIPELKPVYNKAVQAQKYFSSVAPNMVKTPIVAMIDYSKPSTDKRLVVMNTETGEVLMQTEVTHGKGSGGLTGDQFSNTPESHQSSLGAFVTTNDYHGKHGKSLRVVGLQPGINDKVYERNIVVHGSDYIGEGKTGRSFGCFALPEKDAQTFIKLMGSGSMIYAYANNDGNTIGLNNQMPVSMDNSSGGNMKGKTPIGIRQNNPGNLVKTGERWGGELPNATSRFKEFSTPEDGIAGIVRSLTTKVNKRGPMSPYDLIYGRKVGDKLVNPYSATDQAEYAKNIADALGIGINDKYDITDTKQLMTIIKAIIKQENGYNPYSDATIMAGILRK